MHLTQNKNFATLFSSTTGAVQAGQKAVMKIPEVMNARALHFERRVPDYTGKGWVVVVANETNHDLGFVVL